ncbi:MAG TPA: LD-carboxypeptidase [Phycisphaerae bacterium]|nr:LD-carboxypeptidase [Phycisphaerae bacterium]HNU44023.1 LD-carboxypeptidase [Phycisphaerae bacterium]
MSPANLPIIHLAAPAAPCSAFFEHLGVGSAPAFVELMQEMFGPRFRVRGDAALLDAPEDDHHGGRRDDDARAGDLMGALADDDVTAIVTIRGGAWFTRLLPQLDLTVLARRGRPITVFGFSELTTLVNLVAASPPNEGVHYLGPALLLYALRRQARVPERAAEDGGGETKSGASRQACLREQLAYSARVMVDVLDGKEPDPPLDARLVQGTLPERFEAEFVGGNLTVMQTLLGSRWAVPTVRAGWEMDRLQVGATPTQHEHPLPARRAAPTGCWLVLEDLNEKPERIDRMLAALTLAGFWAQGGGLLLGDFHRGYENLRDAVLALLPYHLPRGSNLPVLVTDQIGHVWPMSPLRLRRPLRVQRQNEGTYRVFQARET